MNIHEGKGLAIEILRSKYSRNGRLLILTSVKCCVVSLSTDITEKLLTGT